MAPPPSDDRASSRAEARRRARLAARGELPSEEQEERGAEEPERESGGGFLRRIFPPAPPLPNRPDPLDGFDRSGPLAPVRERVFLLRSNLLAWLVPGFVAFLGFYASRFYLATLLELIGTFVLFGALIAAGWFGWQRPSLYGTAAGLLSYFLASALVLYAFAQEGAGPETFGGPGPVIAELFIGAIYQAGLGFIGGWYGGYLRRRQTHLNRQNRRRR